MAKQQTRTEAAYQKALEIYDARKELEDKREAVKEAEALVKRLEEEHRALVEDGTTEPVAKTEKPKRERKPRSDKGSKVPAKLDDDGNPICSDTQGVYPNAGSLDDVKASVIAQMRADESVWWSVTDLSKTLGIDSKLVSKAVSSFSGIEDNGLQKRAKKYRLVQADTSLVDEIRAYVQADEQVVDEDEGGQL